jgi:hypothetical protein
MKLYRTIRLALTVVSTGACVAMPTAARAQTPETTTSSGTIGVIVLAALLVVASGIAVGLYDRQRRREQKALELQARLSDALLLDPSLPGLTITPTVQMPFSSRGTLVVDVAGYVPTLEVRDAAIQLVRRETAGLDQPIRIEDRMLVNARRHHQDAA